jgi:acetyl esterase/lipase
MAGSGLTDPLQDEFDLRLDMPGSAPTEPEQQTDELRAHYELRADLVYAVPDGHSLRLDVYLPPRAESLNADTLVMFMHGGCWISGSRQDALPQVEAFLDLGMTVANIEYRLASVAHAPSAIDDCRVALDWLIARADEFGFDPHRVIVAGVSSGAHLALMTGLFGPISASSHSRVLPAIRTGTRSIQDDHIRAIVNWSGMTDVAELLAGANPSSYAADWVGTRASAELARLVSPLYSLRPGMPPVLTIHETADPVVPFSQALRLQDALTRAGVRHQFLGIRGEGHGAFTSPLCREATHALREFLFDHDLLRYSRDADPTRGLVDAILERLARRGVVPGQGPRWRQPADALPQA